MSDKATPERISLNYHAPEATSVTLAGSFIGRNMSAPPLKKDEEGIYSTTVKRLPGTHKNRYVVMTKGENLVSLLVLTI